MVYVISIALAIHAVIHLMGFATYWKLARIDGLPYKTTIIKDEIDIGDKGIRLFGLLWVITFIGYAVAIYGCCTEAVWWQPALYFSTVLSLIITVMDWEVAYMGALINAVILALLIFAP